MTYGQRQGYGAAAGVEGDYIGESVGMGRITYGEKVPTPRGQLDAILEDLMALSRRLCEANVRMTKELTRIGGSWPEAVTDVGGGPDSDGTISTIRRVILALSRDVGVFEENNSRLGDI